MCKDSEFSSIIGGMVMIFICVFCIGTSIPGLQVFYDVASLIFMCGIIGGAFLIAYGNDINGLFAYLLTFGRCAPEHIVKIAPVACSFGIWSSLLAGTIGTLIGTINMLSGGMDDWKRLSSGMSVNFLTQFYAVLLALFFYILKHRAERRLNFTAPAPQASGNGE
jgi:flagellar motor component MotA